MKLLCRLLCLLLLWPIAANAQATVELQGNVSIPNAEHFNGFLRIKLTGANLKNICTTPAKPVSSLFNSYTIKNGIVQGLASANFVSQDCLMPRVPYYVEISDVNNIVQSSSNWYLPRTVTGLVDIGDLSEEKFSGPITVAIPQGIISNPAGNQTVTQQPGTSFTFIGEVNLNGQVNFLTTPNFNTILAQQILVGGLSSSTYPLDVQGVINSSGGYLVGGVAPAGTCLLSDGHAYKPGTCNVPFPTLYYQHLVVNGTSLPQANTTEFTNNFIYANLSDRTIVDLSHVGPGAGTYNNISSVSVDSFGRVTNITTASGSNPGARVCNTYGCYKIDPGDGTITEWITGFYSNSAYSNTNVTFPLPYNLPNGVISQQVSTVTNSGDLGASAQFTISSVSTTSVRVFNNHNQDHGGNSIAPYITIVGW